MSVLSKLQPVFIILSALTGTALGKMIPALEVHAGNFIEIFLMIMLFFVFLSVEINDISRSFSDLRFSLSALSINFIITPLFTYLLSKLFLSDNIDLQIGFIMLMVTPCTDWYLIFTALANGNVSLGASILPLNLILQIILLPVYLLIFMGADVSFGIIVIAKSILMVLIMPIIAANVIKIIMKETILKNVLEKILKESDNIQFTLLCLAVISMFSSQGALLLDNLVLFVKLLPPLLIFFAVVFLLSLLTGKIVKLPFKDTIPLVFTTSARNSPISLAMAAITFPLQPVISLVLVIGPLIELPVLAINSIIIKNIGRKK